MYGASGPRGLPSIQGACPNPSQGPYVGEQGEKCNRRVTPRGAGSSRGLCGGSIAAVFQITGVHRRPALSCLAVSSVVRHLVLATMAQDTTRGAIDHWAIRVPIKVSRDLGVCSELTQHKVRVSIVPIDLVDEYNHGHKTYTFMVRWSSAMSCHCWMSFSKQTSKSNVINVSYRAL